MRRSAVILLVLLVAACGGSVPLPSTGPIDAPSPRTTPSSLAPATPSSSPSPSPTPDRAAVWREGLADILPGLDRLHPDPYHATSHAKLEAAVEALDAAIPALDDDHVLAAFLRTAALVSATGFDAHTGIYAWGEGDYPLTSLPLRLWRFPDGVHVVAALPPYEGLIGARVDAIGNTAIDDVIEALDPLIPRDNDQTVDLLLPRFLLIREILRGADVVAEDPVTLTTTATDGTTTTPQLPSIAMAAYNSWAGAYGLHLPVDPDVGYLARQEEPLWFDDVVDGVVYAQYNRVDGVGQSHLDGLAARLAEPGVAALIVDVRHNYGGEVREMERVRRVLEAAPKGIRRFALTGRNTFSAGSLFVARWTGVDPVTVVGDPMGGSPTAFGNPRPVELGDTGLVLDVSTLLEVGSSADDPRLTIEPDLPAPLTFQAWTAGRDPALEAVLAEVAP